MTKRFFPVAFLMLTALGFAGCSNEEEDLFDHSAAERLNAVSSDYTQRLAASKGGWVMEYYPYNNEENFVTGRGYLIMNRFHDNGAVYTLMKNSLTGNSIMEDSTAFEVITDMGPVLTYNTYNKNFGLFTDPTDIPGTESDESGKGFQGDYEFVMVDVPEDGQHIMLKGKKRGVYQRMTRIPEGTDFETYLDDVEAFRSAIFPVHTPTDLLLVDHGERYTMAQQFSPRATIYPEGRDSTAYGWYNFFLVTKYNDQYRIRFKDTTMVDGVQMEQEFAYHPAEDVFKGVVNGDNVIRSPYDNAMQFFQEKFDARNPFKVFRNLSSSELSDKMRTYLNAASDGMTSRNKNYKIDSLVFFRDEGDNAAIWQFKYQSGKSAQDIVYKYTYQTEGNSIAFSFVEAAAANAYNIISGSKPVSAITELITSVLSRKFIIEKYITLFDIRKLKFTAEDDPDLWFVVYFN